MKSVMTNPRGQGFRFEYWYHYLKILRYHAKRLRAQVRLVELTLFRYHKGHQTDGVLRVPMV
jgi:hypothetical protein